MCEKFEGEITLMGKPIDYWVEIESRVRQMSLCNTLLDLVQLRAEKEAAILKICQLENKVGILEAQLDSIKTTRKYTPVQKFG